jgi:hypothetical protein
MKLRGSEHSLQGYIWGRTRVPRVGNKFQGCPVEDKRFNLIYYFRGQQNNTTTEEPTENYCNCVARV